MNTDICLQPSDLVGCRYRLVQASRHPGVSPTHNSQLRYERRVQAKEEARAFFPTAPSLGDSRNFLRIDIPPQGRDDADATDADPDAPWFATLEALAAQATIITNPVLLGEDNGRAWRVRLDALVRRPEGTYMPVLISNHRVARPHPQKTIKVMATARLGLGTPYSAHFKLKHHASDSYALGLAARALDRLGVGSSRAGLIGQDRELVFLLNTDFFQQGLDVALAVPNPDHARRVKECASCRYWEFCEQELKASDDLSLFLSGDRGEPYRERGITTVNGLIDANLGAPSQLARAWRDGVDIVRKSPEVTFPRFDVEIDIDVEAYLDQGAYLWGTYDGEEYRPFVTWEGLGGEAEAQAFARMWAWLKQRREAALAAGKTVGVFCYSAHGENHWLRFSARRFHGRYEGVPSEAEVSAFIASGEWQDVFVAVKKQLAGPKGLGLKVVAPAAGFHWDADDVDGETSVHLYREATGDVAGADLEAAQATLLSYNGDDCRATAAVRHWLAEGAPGVPALEDF
ncbi:TM0106 family RecB-like putative nuclease [Corynebacterium ulcerans]|uniref:Recombinase B n=1 Tax=Corynebacterium ulcerans TaxID=65058 RepID=A0ABD7MV49_CORUL|nr:TM0106 family RecB-like putative nuclease [Corynebacterium ulcerans]QQU26643.1 TM0106 family RecB-like putative nuclease [Corynebacterium ulcerans]SNV09190.1 recombinase B [Corynebacterium ulcerans]SQG52949.1 recombinase B [Corynebacterium ulcerans]SQH03139.1 recombinase B [Corynebacterium ulcerans]